MNPLYKSTVVRELASCKCKRKTQQKRRSAALPLFAAEIVHHVHLFFIKMLKTLATFLGYTARSVSKLVGNYEDKSLSDTAQISYIVAVDMELRNTRNIYRNIKVVDVFCHIKRPCNKIVEQIKKYF